MDFNHDLGILYTGDEAGYMQKWNVEPLLSKLRNNEENHKARLEQERLNKLSNSSTGQARNASSMTGASQRDREQSTFITGVGGGRAFEEL